MILCDSKARDRNSEPQPLFILRGPSGSDNNIYLVSSDGQRKPLFTVQLDMSHKPQVQLSRQLPSPQPNQQLTQSIGTATISKMSGKATVVVHGQEVVTPDLTGIGGNKPFDSPFPCALGPGKLLWVPMLSGAGYELFDEHKNMKVAGFKTHTLSENEPELMMYIPVRSAEEEGFLDMMVLTSMTVLISRRISNKIGLSVFKAVLGGAGA